MLSGEGDGACQMPVYELIIIILEVSVALEVTVYRNRLMPSPGLGVWQSTTRVEERRKESNQMRG
jgi:hypothetical protein